MFKIIAASALALSLTMPLLAAAQFTTVAPPPVTTVTQVYNLTVRILTYLQTFFWIIAAIFIVLAAFQYLTAAGDEEKVKKAKQMIIYAVVAIAIALISTAVVGIVRSVLTG
ncbi:MAG: hypothetical protein QMD50_02425 [Patescibacteria group bacterium]|nr:hypothetical protein [Patescibacteria group bacterium]